MKKSFVSAVAVLALLVAGCASNDDDAGETPDRPEGTPIVLGVIGSFSGAMSGGLGAVDDGAQVWADAVNDAGGINGHPVDLVIKDDALDPAKALQAAKELIDEEGVMAILANHSNVTDSWAAFAEQKGVPVVGGFPVYTQYSTSPNFYPTGSNAATMVIGQLTAMKEAGLSRMGLLYCAEAPICLQLEGLVNALAPIVGGVELVWSGKVSATQPNFTAECVALEDADVDALFVGSAAPTVAAVAKACADAGFDPVDVNQATAMNNQWLQTPALDGTLMAAPNPPVDDTDVPAIDEFLTAVDRFEPSLVDSPQFNPQVLNAWLSGKLFEKAAEIGDLSPSSTPADVKAALAQIKDEDLGGAAPPLSFVEGQPTFIDCWFVEEINGGAVERVGDEPACMTEEQRAQVLEVLAAAG